MKTVFEIGASYIPDGDYVEAYRRGIPTSRRSMGLVAWFAIRAMGWDWVFEAIDRNIRLTREIERQLEQIGFHVLPEGKLSIACVRWEPEGHSDGELDRIQVAISNEVCQSGRAWFATTRHDGKTWLRINMVNFRTREHHLPELMDAIQSAVKHVDATVSPPVSG